MRNIFCLETNWNLTSKKIRDKSSVSSLLTYIENRNSNIECIHRHVATKEELVYYANELKKRTYAKYELLYLAFHGDKGLISLSDKTDVRIEQLSEIFQDRLNNRFVHFGSCRTLFKSDQDIEEFKKETGAKLVSGFTKNVDFDLSSIMDLAFLTDLVETKYPGTIDNRIKKRYNGLISELGFKII